MRIRFVLVAVLLLLNTLLSAQENKNSGHNHHENEIGIANSTVYFINEKEVAYGLHIHYVRNIHDTKFGIGLGYERIFDEHKHNMIGIIGSYNPFEQVIFHLTPGISFEDGFNSDVNFSFHLETIYNFDISNFHLGPVLAVAYDKEDFHISFGLHIGLGF